MSEAMELLGASSKTTIFRLYNKMVELWYLSKSDRKYYPTDLLGALPLYGSVQAWAPTQEPSEVQDHINISSFLIEHPESTFLVSVRWDSMIGAWLVEGDIVVVDKNYSNPKVNDIVIATVDDDSDFTIKYYWMIRNNPVLLPDTTVTSDYKDMESANDTLKPYIVKAYQLWLMKGWEENTFRPKDIITKAEVNAVLIRMILKSYLS